MITEPTFYHSKEEPVYEKETADKSLKLLEGFLKDAPKWINKIDEVKEEINRIKKMEPKNRQIIDSLLRTYRQLSFQEEGKKINDFFNELIAYNQINLN